MPKWIYCKKCGHKYMNSIKRCPQCFAPTPLTVRALIAALPIIVIALAAVILSIVALNGYTTQTSADETTTSLITTKTTVGEITGATNSSASASSPTSTTATKPTVSSTLTQYRQPSDSDGNVVIGNDGIAELTLPKWLLLLTEPDFNYQLTEKEKTEYRFTGIRKNSDGSATYLIEQNDFHRCRLILSSNANAVISGLKRISTVRDVQYTQGQYTTVKVYTSHNSVETLQADNNLAQNIVVAGLEAIVVQYFDIDQNVGCAFELYSADQTLLSTSVFPNVLRK